jgi:uncharacterized BrkB/YihY/UPF0761 family membrane protein
VSFPRPFAASADSAAPNLSATASERQDRRITRREGGRRAAPATDIPPTQSRRERLRRRTDDLRQRAQTERRRLEDARKRSRALDAAFIAYERDVEAGGSVLAAAVGFRLFLFLVPYMFVFVAGFGIIAETSDRSPSAVARDTGIGGLVAQAISDVAGGSTFERVTALVIGVIATFLAARALYKVLRISHALVWGITLNTPAKANRRALGVVGFAAIALVGGAALGGLREASFAVGLLVTVLFAAVVGAFWLLCSWHLPHAAPHWSALLPGAVVVAVGTEVLHLVTVYWVAQLISSKSQTYGTIGTALALLVWAYVAGRLIVSAAVLNASRSRSRAARA